MPPVHWCHADGAGELRDERFPAKIINEHFVNIKIDREERTDIDRHVYMDAVQAMTGSGGSPSMFFLTPDSRQAVLWWHVFILLLVLSTGLPGGGVVQSVQCMLYRQDGMR